MEQRVQIESAKKIFLGLVVLFGLYALPNHAATSADNAKAFANTPPLVRIDSGMLEGVKKKSSFSFKGIPYAAAPIGQGRWREPVSATPWLGVRPADRIGNACMQNLSLSATSALNPGRISEDCLFLNVWTPTLRPVAKLPVMVWIHGGALVSGSGGVAGYDGEALAQRGVVLVSINYRLGAFGFFSHPAFNAERSSNIKNFGLMDQIAALQWVQKNISAFGGDANNVTIFGQSAGAESVLALYSSPLARGLFQKGIAQSPYGIPSHTAEKARTVSIAVASAVGLDGLRASAAQLRAAPANKFVNLKSPELTLAPGFIIGDRALPVSILDTFQAKKEAALPLIIGSNSDEASVAAEMGVEPAKIIEGLGKSKILVKALYPKVSNSEDLGRQVMRDALFTAFARRISYLHSQRAPTWRYYFSYVQERLRGSQTGVPHSGEIIYMMDTANVCACLTAPFTNTDSLMSQKLADSWVAFARQASPQTKQLPSWPKDSVSNDTLMEFAPNNAVRKKFMQPRVNALILGLKAAD